MGMVWEWHGMARNGTGMVWEWHGNSTGIAREWHGVDTVMEAWGQAQDNKESYRTMSLSFLPHHIPWGLQAWWN